MTDNITNELLFETLKAIQSKLAMMGEDISDMKHRMTGLEHRMTSLDMGVAQVHGDFSGQSMRIDRLEGRLGRIETRLNLAD
jgi:hypothetical protein